MIETQQLYETIKELSRPFVDELGLEIIEFNIRHYKGELTLQVLADRKDGGITIGECSQLNKKLSQVIEEKNLIPAGYFLEVSSPGIDRPLTTAKDFNRAIGRDIRVHLSQAFEGKLEWEGLLIGIEGECLVLDGKRGALRIPLVTVSKGVQVF